MPKRMTLDGIARLNATSGEKPVLVLGVNWGAGIEFYASRTIRLGQVNCIGRIIGHGPASQQKQEDSFGTVSAISIELSDADGLMKTRMDITRFEGTPATVFLGYEGTTILDNLPLLQGRITNPIWDEEKRSVSFDVESYLIDEEIGFSATHEDFENLNPLAEGVPWPMIFGKCAHVPVLGIKKHAEGYLKFGIRLYSDVYETLGVNLKLSNKNIQVWTPDLQTTEFSTKNKIWIRGQNRFERNKSIKINIDGVIFEGQFKDDDDLELFDVEKANIPKYENISLRSGLPNDPLFKTDSPQVIYLPNDKIGISNHHVYFKTNGGFVDFYNFCSSQTGFRATMKYPLFDPVAKKQLIDHAKGRIISQVYAVLKGGLKSDLGEKVIRLNELLRAGGQKQTLIDELKRLRDDPESFWSAPADTPVRLWNVADPDVYAVSIVPCEEINGVYAYKTVKLGDGRGSIKVLSEIPKTWYTVELESEYEGATTLLFEIPFADRDSRQEWEEQLYVTATSTVGPNTSEIIEFIANTYSNLIVDSSSFEQVKDKVNDTPSNFALFDQKSAIRAMQEIAWQARCALVIDSGIVFLKFLAEQPSPVLAFDNSNMQAKALNFTFTPTGSITTKLLGTWVETYKYIPALTRFNNSENQEIRETLRALAQDSKRREEPKRINIYRNNLDVFGTRVREEFIYIYNEEDYVLQTINFWGNRFSNSWRLIRFKTFLNALFLQLFDAVSIDVGNANLLVPMVGVVESINFDYTTLDVEVSVWLPSVAGTQSQQDYAYGEPG